MEMKYQNLISKMSLREKVSLLSGKNFWETMDLPKYGIPSVFISDGPNGLRKQAASADHLGLNPSIPATCFPTSATIANSWDPEIARLAGRNIGEEAAAAKVSVLLAPGINIKRNPRCGRNFEYYSEDPYLAGKLAASYIEGVQSNGIISCVKHFACNNQEMGRMASNSIVDERTLREIYLTAFEMAVKEGRVGAVMSAYNRVNDVYCNENNHLLREILRGEWGFGGLIITDWGGENDRVKGLQAGNDLEMPSTQGETNQVVKEAVEKGIIPESLVDEALDRILTAFFATTEALAKASRSFDKAAHHRAALKAAQESIVLLKNEDGILPLKPKTKVAVIGDFAQNPRYQGAGSSIVNPLKLDSVLDLIGGYGLDYIGYEPGFKRYGGDSGKLIKKAMDLGDEADVILLFIGLDEVTESEGIDRKDLRLPTNQLDLIDALYDTGKPIVAVLSCGSVVELPFIDRLAALVHAYLPGEAGAGAILDVLTGKVNPSGKLAETYPFGYPDVPSADHFGLQDFSVQYRESVFVGYRYFISAGVDTRFPFGFGLSYTTFAYSDLTVDEGGAQFTLTNTGSVDGEEVAEMYIGLKNSFVFRPARELKGFAKIALKAGESKRVTIPFDDKSFRYFNIRTNRWEIEKGDYDILVGPSSVDLPLVGTIHREGTDAPAPYDKAKLPHYFSGHVRTISREEFSALLGRPVQDENIKIKDYRLVVDYETPLCNLKYAKGWFGRLFERVIRYMIRFLIKIGHRTDANTLIMGMYYNPMRNMSRMSGGSICWKQLDGMILMFNGHFFKGLHVFMKEGRKMKKIRKEEARALNASSVSQESAK